MLNVHRPPHGAFQSLIWVACPTGTGLQSDAWAARKFQSLIWVACPTGTHSSQCSAAARQFQSLIWVACPTGLGVSTATAVVRSFQSLIWVACPTGRIQKLKPWFYPVEFQSLIWVACPTGWLGWDQVRIRIRIVSIPHMGCMPYGPDDKRRLPEGD